MQTSSEGFQQAYNAQAAVDGSSRLIVAADVGANPADYGRLEEMLGPGSGKPGRLAWQGAGRQRLRLGADPCRTGAPGRRRLPGAGPRRRRPIRRPHPRPGRAWRTRSPVPKAGRPTRTSEHIAEPPFGWIKHVMGFRRFSVRGLRKVQGEWALVCLALNARRINVVAGG